MRGKPSLSPPQRRNLPAMKDCLLFQTAKVDFFIILVKRAASRGLSDRPLDSFGGRLPCYMNCIGSFLVTGRDASLPAPLLSAFAYWSPAERLGRCPKPHKGRCPLTLQGALPLDPFSRLSWSLFLTSSACCSDVPPIHPHTKPRGLRFSHRPRGSVYPITSAYKVRHSHSRRWSVYRPASHPRQ